MKRQSLSGCSVLLSAILAAGVLTAEIAAQCPSSLGPDVIVGSMNGTQRWAGDGTKTAYSFGTTSCNIGNGVLQWIDEGTSTLYPVIGQNMFKLSPDGRFEQIGMSWLKHAFCALQGTLCSTACDPFCGGCCNHLGTCCSDPYSAGLNGDQLGLGPKYDVNAHTGAHSNIDFLSLPPIQNAFSRRVVVQNSDLDAAMNPGALYFIEGQYVTFDDAQNGNQDNNASYRKVLVGAGPTFNLSLDGGTVMQTPAIMAWKTFDPYGGDPDPGNNVVVRVAEPEVTMEGFFMLGYQVTQLEGNLYHYEYALYNMNSHRSARRFTVPIGANVTVSNIGFHDVDYHSGEPFSNVDWTGVVAKDGLSISWETETFAANPNANALRWGTLYNFRFDADSAPITVDAEFEFFRPGEAGDPDEIAIGAKGPGPIEAEPCPWDIDGDGEVAVTDLVTLITSWGVCKGCAADFDGDGEVAVTDLVALITNWGGCP